MKFSNFSDKANGFIECLSELSRITEASAGFRAFGVVKALATMQETYIDMQYKCTEADRYSRNFSTNRDNEFLRTNIEHSYTDILGREMDLNRLRRNLRDELGEYKRDIEEQLKLINGILENDELKTTTEHKKYAEILAGNEQNIEALTA